jgi:hypothetical protein
MMVSEEPYAMTPEFDFIPSMPERITSVVEQCACGASRIISTHHRSNGTVEYTEGFWQEGGSVPRLGPPKHHHRAVSWQNIP